MTSTPRPVSRRQALAGLTAAMLGTGALAACGSGSAAEDTERDLVFAAIPAENSQSLEQTFGHIVTLLEQATGRTVTFQNASDYAAVVEGQRAGKIDIASYGPFSYVIAKDGGVPIEAVAAPVHEEGTDPAYTSLCYVRPDSGISSLADLAGKKVAFVDQASTSGYLVPLKGLMDAGLSIDEDLEVVLAGGHDASLLALAGGEVDAAFAHDTMLKTLTGSGQVEPDALVEAWESEPIPEDPIAVSTETLDEATLSAITEALQQQATKPALVEAGICSSEEDCALPEEIEFGYVEVADADYDSIRDLCTTTEADACSSIG